MPSDQAYVECVASPCRSNCSRRQEVWHGTAFVQLLDDDAEQQRPLGIIRLSGEPVRLRRPVSAMVELTEVSERYILGVIHVFNEQGFNPLDPRWSGARPKRPDDTIRQQIHRLKLVRPCEVVYRFACRSYAKLREHLIDTGTVTGLSCESLQRMLAEFGITLQAAEIRKVTPGPKNRPRKDGILDLHGSQPANGQVSCFDELGSLNPEPRAGGDWLATGRPARLRATYKRAPRGCVPAGRAGHGHRKGDLPRQTPQALVQEAGLLEDAVSALSGRAAQYYSRHLLAPLPPRGRRLVARQRPQTGLDSDLALPSEQVRSRVSRVPLRTPSKAAILSETPNKTRAYATTSADATVALPPKRDVEPDPLARRHHRHDFLNTVAS